MTFDPWDLCPSVAAGAVELARTVRIVPPATATSTAPPALGRRPPCTCGASCRGHCQRALPTWAGPSMPRPLPDLRRQWGRTSAFGYWADPHAPYLPRCPGGQVALQPSRQNPRRCARGGNGSWPAGPAAWAGPAACWRPLDEVPAAVPADFFGPPRPSGSGVGRRVGWAGR